MHPSVHQSSTLQGYIVVSVMMELQQWQGTIKSGLAAKLVQAGVKPFTPTVIGMHALN